MSTSVNNYDAIEQLIFDEGIKMETIDFHPELDIMLIVLNTKAVLRFPISLFPGLANATKESLQNYKLIASGTGVHWPVLDEDLSLKGFLQQELKRSVNNIAAA